MRTRSARSKVGSPRWRGHLSAGEFVEGALLCHRNARRLLQDAVGLLELDRWPSAVFLATHAVEEAAKPALLLEVFLNRGDSFARERAWKAFTDHSPKASKSMSALLGVVGSGGISGDSKSSVELAEFFGQLSEFAREASVYVDCIDEPYRWHDPATEIDRRVAVETVLGGFKLVCAGWVPVDKLASRLLSAPNELSRGARADLRRLEQWWKSDEAMTRFEKERVNILEWVFETNARLDRVPRETRAEPR